MTLPRDRATLSDLPDDILLEIFKRLAPRQLIQVERVCRRWQCIAQQSWLYVRRVALLMVDASDDDAPRMPDIEKEIMRHECFTKRHDFRAHDVITVAMPADRTSLPPVVAKIFAAASNFHTICIVNRCADIDLTKSYEKLLKKCSNLEHLRIVDARVPLSGAIELFKLATDRKFMSFTRPKVVCQC